MEAAPAVGSVILEKWWRRTRTADRRLAVARRILSPPSSAAFTTTRTIRGRRGGGAGGGTVQEPKSPRACSLASQFRRRGLDPPSRPPAGRAPENFQTGRDGELKVRWLRGKNRIGDLPGLLRDIRTKAGRRGSQLLPALFASRLLLEVGGRARFCRSAEVHRGAQNLREVRSPGVNDPEAYKESESEEFLQGA